MIANLSTRILYHYPLCPFSRKIRFLLQEMKIDFSLEIENFWQPRSDFLDLNPAGQVPVLVELNGTIISDSQVIAEYLQEVYTDFPFLGEDPVQRSETRRLTTWFDHKFSQEVGMPILFEKIIKRFSKGGEGPDSNKIRSAKHNINGHLEYISFLIDRRKWLAGDHFSLADITAAAHLSVADYLGDVPWDKHPIARDWYARIKSRPTFRQFLNDRIPGIIPVSYYTDLDF